MDSVARPVRPRSLVAALLTLMLVACSAASRDERDYLAEFGGSRAIYERIAAMTDCASLQAEYDAAAANNAVLDPSTDEYRWTSGYIAAAQDRMDELGCEVPDR
jgi:hypothetical protein